MKKDLSKLTLREKENVLKVRKTAKRLSLFLLIWLMIVIYSGSIPILSLIGLISVIYSIFCAWSLYDMLYEGNWLMRGIVGIATLFLPIPVLLILAYSNKGESENDIETD